MISQRNVESYIFIGADLTSSYVTLCKQGPGDKIMAEYPLKFYISFVSNSTDQTSFYYLNAYYAPYK